MKLIKLTLICIIVLISFIGCTNKKDNNTGSDKLAEKEVKQQVKTRQQGTVMFIVKLKTKLT